MVHRKTDMERIILDQHMEQSIIYQGVSHEYEERF